MRRALGWTLVALLLVAIGTLAGRHLRQPSGDTYLLQVSPSSLRCEERMEISLPTGSINPNLATEQTLGALPGIGPSIARRIVEERESNGFFHYPQDLLSVRGIGKKTLQKLWDQLRMD